MKKGFTLKIMIQKVLINFCNAAKAAKFGDLLSSLERTFQEEHTIFWQKLPPLGERAGVRGQQAFTKTFTLCHLEQSEKSQKAPAKAFTLAEVLITLAIIGVVAAISIPSVISNAQQQEFKTGLRKAVSILNSTIAMNIALDGESPYDNANLFGYLMKHMSIMNTGTNLRDKYFAQADLKHDWAFKNAYFYTTDGMRFEFVTNAEWGGYNDDAHPLYENSDIHPCFTPTALVGQDNILFKCGGCGSYGLKSNSDNTTKPPCLVTVDVNGDRKPTPANINCKERSCSFENLYTTSAPNGKKLSDVFLVMITDKQAIPYGVAAQKAMYGAQK